MFRLASLSSLYFRSADVPFVGQINHARCLRLVRDVVRDSQGRMPVIGATEDSQTALEMLRAGASLTEITSPRALPIMKLLKTLEKEI